MEYFLKCGALRKVKTDQTPFLSSFTFRVINNSANSIVFIKPYRQRANLRVFHSVASFMSKSVAIKNEMLNSLFRLFLLALLSYDTHLKKKFIVCKLNSAFFFLPVDNLDLWHFEVFDFNTTGFTV